MLAIVVVTAGIIFYLSKNLGSPMSLRVTASPAPTITTQTQPNSPSNLPVDDSSLVESDDIPLTEKTITLDAFEYGYSQKTIETSTGEALTIKLVNTGKMSHNFVVDELAIQSDLISAGQETEFTVTFDKPGQYSFYCSVPGHRAQGMEGTLIVK